MNITSEYIEREALLEKARELSNTYSYCGLASVHMIKAIEDAPKADVVEVKHGEWKSCFEDWRKQIEGDECSACGFQHYGNCIGHYHYCPNCGAKMDKKEGAEE